VYGAIIAVLCIMGLAFGVIYLGGAQVSTLQTPETFPVTSSMHAVAPYLVVTPQNHTFVIQYSVTAYQYPLALSYDSFSYLMHYTNGTVWLSYSRACSTTAASQTATNTTSVGSTTVSGNSVVVETVIPCGEPPGSGWAATNSSLIDGHIALTGSEFNVTITPSDIAAGQTEPVNVTVSIELPPGDYAINLTIDAAISSSQFTPYDIEIPVLVTG